MITTTDVHLPRRIGEARKDGKASSRSSFRPTSISRGFTGSVDWCTYAVERTLLSAGNGASASGCAFEGHRDPNALMEEATTTASQSVSDRSRKGMGAPSRREYRIA